MFTQNISPVRRGWGGRQEERVTERAKDREGDSLTGKDRGRERGWYKGEGAEKDGVGVWGRERWCLFFLTALQSGPNCTCGTPSHYSKVALNSKCWTMYMLSGSRVVTTDGPVRPWQKEDLTHLMTPVSHHAICRFFLFFLLRAPVFCLVDLLLPLLDWRNLVLTPAGGWWGSAPPWFWQKIKTEKRNKRAKY
jgi:hypothetical protein